MSLVNYTGTLNALWGIGGPTGSGVNWKDAAGVVSLRNGADSAYADLWCGNLRVANPTVGANDSGEEIVNGVIRFGTGVQSFGVGTGAVTGNARGTGAVDLQTSRTAATQVASGTGSIILGGTNNTASNTGSIAGGTNSVASGQNAVAIGDTVTASGQSAVAFGLSSTSSGTASVAMGQTVQATADYATALGKETLADARGKVAMSGGSIAANGDCQTELLTWGRRTTNATPVVMGLDGTGSVELTVINNASWAFELIVIAATTTASAAKMWTITGAVRRSGSGALAFVGGVAPTPTVIANDAALATATVDVSAPGGGTFTITVTGVAGTTIDWTAAAFSARVVG